MTVAIEKVKLASERFSLIRISGLFYFQGNGIAGPVTTTVTVDRTVYAVFVESVGYLTRVFDAVPADGEYSYDDETFELVVTTNGFAQVYVSFYLFYTTGKDRVYFETPTDDATTARIWKGRLKSGVNVRKSMTNQLNGFFTTSTSGAKIVDVDRDLQSSIVWAHQNTLKSAIATSFYKQTADIWMVINGEILKVGQGLVDNIASDSEGITFNFSDKAINMTALAYLGDDDTEIYFTGTSLPCKYVFGRSGFDFKSHLASGSLGGDLISASNHRALTLDKAKCEQARTSSSALPATFSLCRTGGATLKTLNFGVVTLAKLYATASDYYMYHGTKRAMLEIRSAAPATHNIEVGDSFKFTDPTFAGNCYAIVTSITFSGGTGYTFLCMVMNQDTCAAATITGSITLFANSAPAVILFDQSTGTDYLLSYLLDFTISTTATSGGNSIQKIVTVASFDTATAAGLGGAGVIHPDLDAIDLASDGIFFRVTTATMTVQAAVELLLENAGLTVGSLTFGGGNASFTVPYFGETDYDTVGKYVRDAVVMTSTFLYSDEDDLIQDINYGDFFSSTVATISDDLILKDSFGYSIEYRDMASLVDVDSVHNPDATETFGPSSSNSILHGISDASTMVRIQVPNLGATASFGTQLYRIKTNPIYKLQFAVAMSFLELKVGDTLTISTNQFLGSDAGTHNKAIITSLDVGTDKIQVEAIMPLTATVVP